MPLLGQKLDKNVPGMFCRQNKFRPFCQRLHTSRFPTLGKEFLEPFCNGEANAYLRDPDVELLKRRVLARVCAVVTLSMLPLQVVHSLFLPAQHKTCRQQ